jgi:PHS family inorganic phosphate transporter-like MFS transporter
VSLNNPIILSTIGFSGGSTVYRILMNTAIGNLIIVLAGAIPGYWVCLIISLLYPRTLLSLIE